MASTLKLTFVGLLLTAGLNAFAQNIGEEVLQILEQKKECARQAESYKDLEKISDEMKTLDNEMTSKITVWLHGIEAENPEYAKTFSDSIKSQLISLNKIASQKCAEFVATRNNPSDRMMDILTAKIDEVKAAQSFKDLERIAGSLSKEENALNPDINAWMTMLQRNNLGAFNELNERGRNVVSEFQKAVNDKVSEISQTKK